MDQRERLIVAQTAYKCAAWIHAAEVQGGGVPDTDHLFEMARKVANGMIKLSGAPSAPGVAGGSSPASPSAGAHAASVPSCPRCNEPMEPNANWTGLGNVEGHKQSESIKWRCSQRGKFIKDRGWTGCDGVKWEDRAA